MTLKGIEDEKILSKMLGKAPEYKHTQTASGNRYNGTENSPKSLTIYHISVHIYLTTKTTLKIADIYFISLFLFLSLYFLSFGFTSSCILSLFAPESCE